MINHGKSQRASFVRNILGHSPRHLHQEIAAQLKLIFYAEDMKTAKKLARDFIKNFEDKAQKAIDNFEAGLESALTVLVFPLHYRKRLRTSNLPERRNEEIRRRQRVIRIFPNENSALRLIGSLLADFYDNWKSQNNYFDMTEYWDWKKESQENKSSALKVVDVN